MAIKCGNCQGAHDSVAAVRNCYDGDSSGTLHVDLDEEARAEQFFRQDVSRELPATRATDKQVKFIRALFGRKAVPAHLAPWAGTIKGMLPSETMPCMLGKAEAAAAIDQLLKLTDLPKETLAANVKARTSKQLIDSDGMFRTPDGEIYKVQYAVHGSGRLYAKQLVLDGYEEDSSGEYIPVQLTRIPIAADLERDFNITFEARFVYRSGAIYSLKPEWRMTKEEAKQFGALYGACVRCGLPLTKEESIERGMGDICASKDGYWG